MKPEFFSSYSFYTAFQTVCDEGPLGCFFLSSSQTNRKIKWKQIIRYHQHLDVATVSVFERFQSLYISHQPGGNSAIQMVLSRSALTAKESNSSEFPGGLGSRAEVPWEKFIILFTQRELEDFTHQPSFIQSLSSVRWEVGFLILKFR